MVAMTGQTISPKRRPVAVYAIAAYAALQTVRVFAVPIIFSVTGGTVAEAWLFPAMMDVLIGATALFVAYGLVRRRGLAAWTAAIVFFALSISDHLDALTVSARAAGPAPAMMANSTATVIQLAVMSVLELAAVAVLATRLRSYYLGKEAGVTM